MAHSAADHIRAGSTNTVLRCTFIDQNSASIDVSTPVVLEVDIEQPDGTIITRTLTPSGSPVNEATYNLQPADIPTAGTYTFQGYAEVDAWKGFSQTKHVKVKGNLKQTR